MINNSSFISYKKNSRTSNNQRLGSAGESDARYRRMNKNLTKGRVATEMLTSVLMWLGRRVAARGICLRFQIGQILRTFTVSPTTRSTSLHLGFERDYNYHTFFRVCYGIMH